MTPTVADLAALAEQTGRRASDAIPQSAKLTQATSGTLMAAIEAWRDTLGPEFVLSNESARTQAGAATFAVGNRVPCVLRPANTSEVQQCLRIATRHGVPVYPVSRGKNWGYGSSAPSRDGCALLDLSRLNQILEYNEQLAYVTLEPGVTQQQLYDFLAERGGKLWMDATGAGPEASVIGNVLERGFGHTPYGERIANTCAYEVVLPNGERIETGAGRLGANSAHLYRWGIGPSIDGLFSQSNFGVVTRMTIWLMPKPEYFSAYFLKIDGDDGIIDAIDAFRRLRLSGTVRTPVHIGNGYKVLSGLRQYPWEHAGGSTPLPVDVYSQMQKELSFGAWNGAGALYGSKAQVKEARRLMKVALGKHVNKLQFLDDRMLAVAERFAGPFSLLTGMNLRHTIAMAKPVVGLMKGIPTAHPLRSAYWRVKMTPPSETDLHRDGCGLLWYAPMAPMEGAHAKRLSDIAAEVMGEWGFEPVISISLLTERALCAVISITYDRSVPGQDEAALGCYRALAAKMTENRYAPYRAGLASMTGTAGTDSYSELLTRLKESVDPGRILAPGRYEGLK